MKAILIIALLLLVLASGCIQETGLMDTGQPSASELEDQGAALIEEELEKAIENVDTSDIEDDLLG